MEGVAEAEGTNGQRLMVRIAEKRGQRTVQRLIAAGRLRMPAGYAKVLTTGQAAFQAACRWARTQGHRRVAHRHKAGG
eukprot:15431571-Alexandrium_andersonii.AAC.1